MPAAAALFLGAAAFWLTERFFSAPAWYRHEREESGITELKLSEDKERRLIERIEEFALFYSPRLQ